MVKYCRTVWCSGEEEVGSVLTVFDQVLNVEDVREVNINAFGDRRMPMLEELNEREISIKEVREVANEMKLGKAPGLDGFPVECLKKRSLTLVRMVSETV